MSFTKRPLIFTILFLASVSAQAGELQGVIRNNQGVHKFSSDRGVEAFELFVDALGELPFAPEVHYNVATTFLRNQEFDKALSEYRHAIKLAPGTTDREKEIRFFAHFNSAVALTQLKRVDEALEEYQKALEENPASVETKTNIELLTQQQQGGQGQGDQKQDQSQKDDQKKKDDQKGEGQDPKDQKDQDPKDQKDQEKQPKQPEQNKQKPTPRPFKSEQLTQQDVNRILDELKQQEEQIRAKFQKEGGKDVSPEKDW